LGLLISGLLISIFVSNFTRARRAALAARQTEEKAAKLRAEMLKEARKDFDPERGITNREAFKVDSFQKLYADAAREQTGDQAKLSRATAIYFGKLAEIQKEVQRIFPQIQAAELEDFSALSDAEVARKKKKLLDDFIQINDRLSKFLTGAPKALEEELRKQQASPEFREQSVRGFSQGLNKQNQIRYIVNACRARTRYGKAVIATYDFLEQHRGKWTLSKDDEINFAENAIETAYDPLRREWNEASAKQTEAEAELIEMQRRMLNQKAPAPARGRP
jgi:hypothetical protein